MFQIWSSFTKITDVLHAEQKEGHTETSCTLLRVSEVSEGFESSDVTLRVNENCRKKHTWLQMNVTQEQRWLTHYHQRSQMGDKTRLLPFRGFTVWCSPWDRKSAFATWSCQSFTAPPPSKAFSLHPSLCGSAQSRPL